MPQQVKGLFPVFSDRQLVLIHMLVHQEVETLETLQGIKRLSKEDRDKKIIAQEICELLTNLEEMEEA